MGQFNCPAADYRHLICGGTFQQPDDWSDEQARAQLEAIKPGIDHDSTALVCEDCCRRVLPGRN